MIARTVPAAQDDTALWILLAVLALVLLGLARKWLKM